MYLLQADERVSEKWVYISYKNAKRAQRKYFNKTQLLLRQLKCYR